MELVFATQNANKAAEIQKMVPAGIKVLTLRDLGCEDDIPETGDTLEDNARIKAQYVYDKFGKNCFADDTGLEVKALDGKPGVKSARYAGEQKNSQDNMNLLLKEMADKTDRSARFRTVISLIIAGREILFEGVVNGEITHSPAGSDGFGYDPVFKPEGLDRTFAQMNLEEKNRISHRGRAVRELIGYLHEIPGIS